MTSQLCHKLCGTWLRYVNCLSSKCSTVFALLNKIILFFRTKIIQRRHNLLWVLTLVSRILENFILRFRSGYNTNIRQPMIKLPTNRCFIELLLKFTSFNKAQQYSAVNGVCSAGFTTITLPAARAGAIFQTNIGTG